MRNVAVPGRWLRHSSGQIYGYTPHLAVNPAMVEVTEEEAFPERFMTKSQRARFVPEDTSKKSKKAKKGKLKLNTAEDVIAGAEGPADVNHDLAADASRGM